MVPDTHDLSDEACSGNTSATHVAPGCPTNAPDAMLDASKNPTHGNVQPPEVEQRRKTSPDPLLETDRYRLAMPFRD